MNNEQQNANQVVDIIEKDAEMNASGEERAEDMEIEGEAQVESSVEPTLKSTLEYFDLTGAFAIGDEQADDSQIADAPVELNDDKFVYAQFE